MACYVMPGCRCADREAEPAQYSQRQGGGREGAQRGVYFVAIVLIVIVTATAKVAVTVSKLEGTKG